MRPINESKEIVKKILKERFKDARGKRILRLWDDVAEGIYTHIAPPFPVSHGVDHIAKVIENIDLLIDKIPKDRISYYNLYYNDALFSLFAAALIHDVGMINVVMKTEGGIDYHRMRHSNQDVIRKIVTQYMKPENWPEYEGIICIAQSHSGCALGINGGDYTVEEKINIITRESEKYTFKILILCNLLRFADFFDLRYDRLIYLVNPDKILSEDQIHHQTQQENISVKINTLNSRITLFYKEGNKTISEHQINKIKKDAQNHFENINQYLNGDWKLEFDGFPEKEKPKDSEENNIENTPSPLPKPPKNSNQFDAIRNSISNNNIQEALELLVNFIEGNKDYKNEMVSLTARYNLYKEKVRRGTLHINDENILINKIRQDFLDFLSLIEKDIDKKNPEEKTNQISKNVIKVKGDGNIVIQNGSQINIDGNNYSEKKDKKTTNATKFNSDEKDAPSMNSSYEAKRMIQLEVKIHENNNLLDEWEQKRDVSENPSERKRCDIEIDKIKKQISKYISEQKAVLPNDFEGRKEIYYQLRKENSYESVKLLSNLLKIKTEKEFAEDRYRIAIFLGELKTEDAKIALLEALNKEKNEYVIMGIHDALAKFK